MKRNFIVDQEVKLLDETDFLNTKVYADILQKMIRNSPNDKPFTIGLFGEWGSGKSSIIKTAQSSLEASNDFKTKFVVFDAWKYSEDAFRRSFILALSKQVGVELNKREFNLYANHTQQINEIKIKIPTWVYVVLGIVSIGLIVSYLTCPWFRDNSLKLMSTVTLFLATSTFIIFLKKIIDKELLTKFLGVIQTLIHSKYDEERPLMFSPEQFSTAFDFIVDKVTPKYQRLVIVIDNIDRCERQYTTELLSTIKGFLESKEKVLFVLPVDETALKRHVRESYNAGDKEADEFLRKFFNTTLKIKPYNSSEIYFFAKQINQKYELGFSDYTIDLVSKEYASNPRRIIQIFNNLSTELECFTDKKFIDRNETAICKLLILREEFPAYYHRLAKNPYILKMPIETYNNDKMWSEELAIFINKTKVITENTLLKDINTILSNSTIYNSMPEEIGSYIDNLQVDKIKEFIGEDNDKFNMVIDFLIRELESYKDRKLIGSTFINNLDLLVQLNAFKEISLTNNKRIEEIITSELQEIFNQKGNFSDLVQYSKMLQTYKRNYLLDFIISSLNNIFMLDNPPQKMRDAFKMVISIFDNPQILKRLKKAFFEYYKLDASILDKNELSKEKVINLNSDDLSMFIIDRIASINDSDPYYIDILFLLSKDASSFVSEHTLIQRINNINPNFNGKGRDEITPILYSINNLILKFIHDFSTDYSDLEVLANNLLNNRTVPNPNYPTQRAYDTNGNYVSECIASNSGIDDLISFCMTIYKLTKGKITSADILQTIAGSNEYRETVNNKISQLIVESISISPLITFIMTDESYSETSLKLLDYVIRLNSNQNDLISDDQLESKIDHMLNLIFVDNERKQLLEEFLKKLSDLNNVIQVIIQRITNHSKDEILKLSPDLQSLAIDTILQGDSIFDYANNINFLKVIAANGNNQHIKKLLKVILTKLQQDDELMNAIEIILDLKQLTKSDSARLTQEMDTQSENPIIKDQYPQIINHIKSIARN
jgi:hypothetical protein